METERTEMNRRPGRIPIVVMTLLATLAVGVGAGAVAYSTFADDTKTVIQEVSVDSEPTASSSTLTAAQIYRNTNRSVVEITVGSVQVDPFGGEQQQRGQGSGFVYDSDGHIVTNDHVVEGAETVSVRFWNGNTYDANVVGTDPSTDLAVIKVDAPDSVLHPLTVGDSSDVQVGNTVFALGSPFGLEDSFTSGIVSALHRSIEAPNDFTINDSIQTDAAINHGNSGGPLLNSSGEVIGVNAQIAGNTGANVGIGFAIPSNTVKKIAAQLIDTGEVEHAYLGVQVQDVPASVADELGLVEGVQIAEFPNTESRTPAQRAGLRAATGQRTIDGEVYSTGGDVVTEIDGQKITSTEELQRAIDAKKPGDTITITYWRNGESHTVDVKLANRPDEVAPPAQEEVIPDE
jgi:S1-C subfamily serine protease